MKRLTALSGLMLVSSLAFQSYAGAQLCSEVFTAIHEGVPVQSRAEKQAGEELSLLAKLESEHPDDDAMIFGERRSLEDFLAVGENNLAVKAPMTVMNSAQRMLSMILSQGEKTVFVPTTGERVAVYPFFSGGSTLTNGRMIVGNETAIDQFVSNIRAQARGDRSGSTIPLFVGSHGTGKSEFLTILGAGADELTRQPNSKYAVYTYEWHGLEAIPSLLPYLTATSSGGKSTYSNIPAPLGDSPFTLFPKEVQDLILKQAAPVASSLIEGDSPKPIRQPDPVSQFIRTQIIQHYSSLAGHALSAKEIVNALSKHVDVTRVVMGRSSGKMPLIDAQGNDLDVAGLFMTPNPVVRFASGAGPAHVMAWYLNGKVLNGHGNAVLFDEFFRNPEELRNMLLGAFESRVLSVGGAPSVPFDAVMVAATNTANLEDVRGEGKGAASADRFKIIPMRWPTDPHQVAQVLLLGKLKDMTEQSLNADEGQAPVQSASMTNLYPHRETLAQFSTPDHRYRLVYGQGKNRVEIAPHTLTMMAEIVSASRMHTDAEAAGKLFSGKIVSSPYYRDPIQRLMLFEGLSANVTPAELAELHKLALLTKEGESGISARDAGKWFSQAIDEASKPWNNQTLTPAIALKVFRKMLNAGSIQYNNQKDRMAWEGLATEVPQRLLLPRLESDISNSLANGDRVVNSAYFEMLEEFMQIEADPNSTSYISSTSRQERVIDRNRLQKVLEIYKKKTGRDLNIAKIAIFHAQQGGLHGGGQEPDRALFESVAEYYAQLNTQVAGLRAIAEFARTGQGSEEVRATFGSLIDAMKRLGYSERAAIDALNLVQNVRSQRGE